LNETKEMFYLEKSLWINASSSIRDLASSITDRLEKLIASSNTIGTSRSAFVILNLVGFYNINSSEQPQWLREKKQLEKGTNPKS
jgi:hypothetical protein